MATWFATSHSIVRSLKPLRTLIPGLADCQQPSLVHQSLALAKSGSLRCLHVTRVSLGFDTFIELFKAMMQKHKPKRFVDIDAYKSAHASVQRLLIYLDQAPPDRIAHSTLEFHVRGYADLKSIQQKYVPWLSYIRVAVKSYGFRGKSIMLITGFDVHINVSTRRVDGEVRSFGDRAIEGQSNQGEGKRILRGYRSNESVGDLKDAIRKKKQNDLKTVDTDKLHLFLAKKSDDTWLDRDGAEAVTLDEHGHPEGFTHMDPLLWLKNLKNFGDNFKPNVGEIHVLVVVPKGTTTEDDRYARQREFQRTVCVLVDEAVTRALQHKSKSLTDRELGDSELKILEENMLVIDVAPRQGEAAFWSEEIQDQVNAITNAAAFDALLMPYINEIVTNCGLVFVKSENYRWLFPSPLARTARVLLPYGFETQRGMYRTKPVPNGVERPSDIQCRLGDANEDLFDCLILFERKHIITEAAFGQMLRYQQNLVPTGSAYAILFDRHSFWLIISNIGVILKVQKAKWVDNGSKALFQNFITDKISPWV